MRVATVLRSGGIYRPAHVEALARQLKQWLPFDELLCFSDMFVPRVETVPLLHKWPGWWSKMEIFRPDIAGDLLYMDLDTLLIGPLDDIVNVNRLTILRDFYRDGVYKGRPEGLQSSLMLLPEADRSEVWADFARNPEVAMNSFTRLGDQGFLERHFLERAARWQDVLPGQVVSLKVHCRNGVPSNTRVICAHGKPKFWDLPEYKHFYE